MAITASVQPEMGRTVYTESDFPHPFQHRFSKEVAKPTWIRSGWPGQGLAKLIWSGSKSVCKNHLARFLAGRNRPATSFPFSDSVPFSTNVPDNIVQNQPESDLVLADCVRFWPNGSGPEASRCARIIRPASGQCFPVDPDRIRIGSGMFTGMLLTTVRKISCSVPSKGKEKWKIPGVRAPSKTFNN